jgi:diaminohydroxyphosphoribosylaminopyrimidine deaminase/5-amino-6-(5-phosphoribosylamino)uracil reductase
MTSGGRWDLACSPQTEEERWMRKAIGLARLGLGTTAPNPCVGAILVRDGQMVARGWHSVYGGPHAEVVVLEHARSRGINPAGCTLYVTLEPCNHFGKTPPCTEAILAAGIRQVVVGTLDPNRQAAGGAQRLRAAGVHVVEGVCEAACRDLVADFRLWQTTDRPYVFLKLAQTLDGKIAPRPGTPGAISGLRAQRLVHRLRARVGAILIGGGTLRADNPQLTCRHHTFHGIQPLAAVATRTLPQPPQLPALVEKRPDQTIFFTAPTEAQSVRAEALRRRGCHVHGVPEVGSGLNLEAAVTILRCTYGCHYVLAEGGGTLAASLLEAGLADEILLFIAPKVLGHAAAPASFQGRTTQTMADALSLRPKALRWMDPDLLLTFRPLLCSPASSNPLA